MNKILIITYADMSLQSGNIVLVNRRAEELYKKYNIKTTCLVNCKISYKNIKHDIDGIEYVVMKNKLDIKNFIEKNSPEKVVFYGVKSYFYIPYVKTILKRYPNIKIYLDVQGAFEETIEFSKGLELFKNYIKYILQKITFVIALNLSDGIFVVSDELKEYCLSSIRKKKYKDYKVVKFRCGLNEIINTKQRLQWREQVRDELHIDKDAIVMVFSGYRQPWQNVDKMVSIFREYDKIYKKCIFTFFCDIDDEFEKYIKNSFPNGNYILKFLSFDEYFKHLCACDVGFLVRDYNVTNEVAFPNKFSDYLNAGLMIAMNQSLPEPCRVLYQSKIDNIDIDKDKYDENILKILNRHENLIDFYDKCEKVCEDELLYSKQIEKYKYDFQ